MAKHVEWQPNGDEYMSASEMRLRERTSANATETRDARPPPRPGDLIGADRHALAGPGSAPRGGAGPAAPRWRAGGGHSTLVLAERHARPGQEVSLLAALQRLGSDRALYRDAIRSLRIFVDIAAPTHVLTAGQWATRAAYEAAVPDDPAVQALDTWCLGPPRYWFFEPLVMYREFSRAPAVMGCALVETRPTEITRVRDLLMRLRKSLLDSPDLLQHTLAQEQGAPHVFLVMHGWTTLAALEEFRRTSVQTPREILLSAGVESIQQFTGYVRGDFTPAQAALLRA